MKEGREVRRREANKESDAQEQEESLDDGEELISTNTLMDSKNHLTTIEQYEREYDGMKDMLYHQRLNAFDEDFAASQLNFIGG